MLSNAMLSSSALPLSLSPSQSSLRPSQPSPLALATARDELFRYGPHALYGRVFTDLFQFRPYGNASQEALQRVKPARQAVRVSVHLRHREACMTGSELVESVARAVVALAKPALLTAGGRSCQVLLASDRRRTIALLTPLVAPCEVITVSRAAASLSRGKFVENGVGACIKRVHLYPLLLPSVCLMRCAPLPCGAALQVSTLERPRPQTLSSSLGVTTSLAPLAAPSHCSSRR